MEEIRHLYKLCQAYDNFGAEAVAAELGISLNKVKLLYASKLHDSTQLESFFKAPDEHFDILLEKAKKEEIERQAKIHQLRRIQIDLVDELLDSRKTFAGLGTKRAKRWLNKLALTDPVGKAVRLALEIEDVDLCAKDSFWPYEDWKYRIKAKLLVRLEEVFDKQEWRWGVLENDDSPTDYYIYFDIPGCEQLSWDFNYPDDQVFYEYDGEVIKSANSNLKKLAAITRKLFNT